MSIPVEVKEYLCTQDPKLTQLFENVGDLDFDGLRRPPFVALLGAIVGQKIRYTTAKELRGKIFSVLGTDFTPQDVLSLSPEIRGTIGANWALIDRVSNYILENSLDLTSVEDVRKLNSVPGIGLWTIENVLVTSFMDWDCFPRADKFLETRIRKLYGPMSRKEINTLAESWSPYRTVVTWYLWRWF